MPNPGTAFISSVQSSDRLLNQMQSNILNVLNPFLTNPFLFGRLLTDVALVSGDNIINHGLNRVLQGWVLVRVKAVAVIYDNQNSNTQNDTTLILNSDGTYTVNLYVF